jgi:serine phosphatase RsbU (regulator of sigma subunit)
MMARERMRSKISSPHWRSRLIAGATILAVVALAVTAGFIYLAYERTAGDLIIQRDRQVAFLSAARLKDQMAGYTGLLATVARSLQIYGNNDAAQAAALASAGQRLMVFDAGVVLLNRSGKVKVAQPSQPALLGQDWPQRDFVGRLANLPEAVFSDVMPDGPGGAPVVGLGVPIVGEQGNFDGALVGLLRIDDPATSSLYSSIARLPMNQGTTVFVVDGQGRIVYDSGFSSIAEVQVGRQAAAASAPNPEGANRTRDAEGDEVVAARALVPGTGWSLITQNHWAELTASTRRYGTILLGVLVLGMILPALGMVLLVSERNAQVLDREREEQELRMAGLIQKNLFPKQVPVLPGWNVAVHYQPSAASGGDFYDFLFLPDGRLMLALGDIADRSVTGTMAIATTRATLRSTARRLLTPGSALVESNTMLCPEMQHNMCVFCVYGILDPLSGRLDFANAGYLPPWLHRKGKAERLALSGQPLGLLLDAQYEESIVVLQPGEYIVFCGNGLIEARNAHGEMFGFGRVKAAMERQIADANEFMQGLLADFEEFVGKGMALQDDITIVVLERAWSVPTD